MLEYYQYPDVSVFDEVVSGVNLSGAAPDVPFFEPGFKPAKVTESELASSAAAKASPVGQVMQRSTVRFSTRPRMRSRAAGSRAPLMQVPLNQVQLSADGLEFDSLPVRLLRFV